MKHAYLIIAHNEFEILEKLIACLDDERNDIFIHFDSKLKELPALSTRKAHLNILKNRIDIRWADISMVEAELALFEAALSANTEYSHLHLLSGVDLPLKSQDEIHAFFAQHTGKEFIGFSQYDYSNEVKRKMNRWHLFPKCFRSGCPYFKVLRALHLRLQIMFDWQRNTKIAFRKGTQWVSITPAFARFIVSKKSDIQHIYRNTFCADEVFLHTLCWNSPFRENIFNSDNEADGCLRMIGWKNGQLFDWTDGDYNTLKASSALFARKFNSQNMQVVEQICNDVTQNG